MSTQAPNQVDPSPASNLTSDIPTNPQSIEMTQPVTPKKKVKFFILAIVLLVILGIVALVVVVLSQNGNRNLTPTPTPTVTITSSPEPTTSPTVTPSGTATPTTADLLTVEGVKYDWKFKYSASWGTPKITQNISSDRPDCKHEGIGFNTGWAIRASKDQISLDCQPSRDGTVIDRYELSSPQDKKFSVIIEKTDNPVSYNVYATYRKEVAVGTYNTIEFFATNLNDIQLVNAKNDLKQIVDTLETSL